MTDLIDVKWPPSPDGIQVITLGSPHHRNALGAQLPDKPPQALPEARDEPSATVIAASPDTFAFTEARLGPAQATPSTTVLPVLTPRAASSAFLTAGTFPDPPQRIDAPGDRLTASASELFRSPVAERRISGTLCGCRPVSMAGRSGA